MDLTFKALADPTRRRLLDRLRAEDGQTLGQLCERLDMARQSATQHLDVLVRANLVTIVRRGRERLHYLNPVPIHDIERRWIAAFDRPRLRVLSEIRTRAEEEVVIPNYVYVTYIKASPQRVWQALTDADLTAAYWGHANVSDWRPGSRWDHRRADDSGIVDVTGHVLEADPPTRLVITFEDSPDEAENREPSVVTFLVEQHEDIVRLTVTHEKLPNEQMLDGISAGWPAVLANLKSLLETGAVLPQAPWTMAPPVAGRR
jgi:uncharacterized protein YndB with AHSA1/START domain/DNA-binding transcriptional ArsR family regulator